MKTINSETGNQNITWMVIPFVGMIWIFLIALLLLFGDGIWLSELSKKEQGANALNGILGPAIALFGAILTTAAFYIQYKANQIQYSFSRRQDHQQQVDRFEQRFFEILRIHRENSDKFQISIDPSAPGEQNPKLILGKEAFRIAAMEVEKTYRILWEYRSFFQIFEGKSELQIMGNAYLLVYWGFDIEVVDQFARGRYSFSSNLNQIELEKLNALKMVLNGKGEPLKRVDCQKTEKGFCEEIYALTIKEPMSEKLATWNRKSPTPKGQRFWQGYHAHWSTYIRNIYRAYEIIDNGIDRGVISIQEAGEYAILLRTQMSNDEQKLLFYLSQTNIGNVMCADGLGWAVKYIPYKNINKEELPSEIDPHGWIIKQLQDYYIQNPTYFSQVDRQIQAENHFGQVSPSAKCISNPVIDYENLAKRYFDYLTDFI